jgi:hypothetical protein
LIRACPSPASFLIGGDIVNASQFFIILSIAVLAVVAVLVFFTVRSRKENSLTPLAGLAFGFVIAGLIFGADRLVGYPLLGIGVILAVVDMFRRAKNK